MQVCNRKLKLWQVADR